MASPSDPPAKKTIALYQKDSTLHQHTTTISSISPLSSQPPETLALFKPPPDDNKPPPYILTTPSTIFHPQGGGQPSDTGTITPTPSTPSPTPTPIFKVTTVRSQPPSILHLGTFHPWPPPTNPETIFPPNAPITQTIDIPTRHLHSRLHTAGHALGLAVMSLTNTLLPADLKEGKASHSPGTASVEFLGLIPGTAKSAIQDTVDGLVARDLRVLIYFVGEEEARVHCGGVADGVQGDGVRVVEIEGAGAYPCGGTHVCTLKEVGRVVVKGIKRQKGVSKVSYEVVDAI